MQLLLQSFNSLHTEQNAFECSQTKSQHICNTKTSDAKDIQI